MNASVVGDSPIDSAYDATVLDESTNDTFVAVDVVSEHDDFHAENDCDAPPLSIHTD